jgi:hypothetical protein
MRHLVIALGLCLSVGILSSPLSAAARNNAAHHTMLVKAKKNRKFKAHKAPKRHARKANRAN